jgi:hypothetical protein
MFQLKMEAWRLQAETRGSSRGFRETKAHQLQPEGSGESQTAGFGAT